MLDESTEESYSRLISELMLFFKGGISYTELKNLPIPELIMIRDNAERMSKEQEAAMRK